MDNGLGATVAYLWNDNGTHKVTAAALTELGALNNVTYEQLANLTSSHIIG